MTGKSFRVTHRSDSSLPVYLAVASTEVLDIFEAAGLKKPDISILSDQFLAEVHELPQKNLAVELLKKLLLGEIKTRSRRNVVQARLFSDLLEKAIRKYQNRAVENRAGDRGTDRPREAHARGAEPWRSIGPERRRSCLLRRSRNERQQRTLPLLEPVRSLIAAYHEQCVGISTGWLFTGRTAQPVKMESFIKHAIMPAVRKAELRWYGLYAARRSCATNLVHRPISSLWNRLAFVGLDGGEAFWGEGPDSPWWSR
jgi:hypothetical protein